jgi:hypothetical protein
MVTQLGCCGCAVTVAHGRVEQQGVGRRVVRTCCPQSQYAITLVNVVFGHGFDSHRLHRVTETTPLGPRVKWYRRSSTVGVTYLALPTRHDSG